MREWKKVQTVLRRLNHNPSVRPSGNRQPGSVMPKPLHGFVTGQMARSPRNAIAVADPRTNGKDSQTQ